MLSVANRVPDDLIESVGPAHSVGRRSWMALANLLAAKPNVVKARKLASEVSFRALPSKERFETLLKGISERSQADGDTVSVSHAGREVGRISETRQRVTLSVDRKASPEFATFVLNELPRLFELHLKQQG
jgi:ParB family chromosome partitioning protein